MCPFFMLCNRCDNDIIPEKKCTIVLDFSNAFDGMTGLVCCIKYGPTSSYSLLGWRYATRPYSSIFLVVIPPFFVVGSSRVIV